jgi:membrane protease YdiL (CAAX protease family)
MNLKKIYNLVQSITTEPLNFKKAILLFLYAEGVFYMARFLLRKINIFFGLIPDILYLIVVLMIVLEMGKDELRRIFAWRNVPLPVFGSILVMYFGFEIITSELGNLFQMILPVPYGFFDGLFYEPENVFLLIVTGAIFPGFSEEVFFRGIIARKFFRTYSPARSIVLSAALFGIIHLNPWQMTNAFFYGIFYGWVYWRCKSIWLCMFMHAYHNILVHFMTYPYVSAGNFWLYPAWLDILGLLLFGFGFLSIIELSPKNNVKKNNRTSHCNG